MKKRIVGHSELTPDEVFTGNIDSVISRLVNIRGNVIDQYPEAAEEDIFIESDYVGYDGELEFWISYTRYETDAEVAAREAKEAKELARKVAAAQRKLEKESEKKAKKEQSERELYEMLKAKYG